MQQVDKAPHEVIPPKFAIANGVLIGLIDDEFYKNSEILNFI